MPHEPPESCLKNHPGNGAEGGAGRDGAGMGLEVPSARGL